MTFRGKISRYNQFAPETLIREKYNPEGINESNWKVDFKISNIPPGFSIFLFIINVPGNKFEGKALQQRQDS